MNWYEKWHRSARFVKPKRLVTLSANCYEITLHHIPELKATDLQTLIGSRHRRRRVMCVDMETPTFLRYKSSVGYFGSVDGYGLLMKDRTLRNRMKSVRYVDLHPFLGEPRFFRACGAFVFSIKIPNVIIMTL